MTSINGDNSQLTKAPSFGKMSNDCIIEEANSKSVSKAASDYGGGGYNRRNHIGITSSISGSGKGSAADKGWSEQKPSYLLANHETTSAITEPLKTSLELNQPQVPTNQLSPK